MSLERELTALASALDWPEAPDVATVVVTRLAEPRSRGRLVPRRRAALAAALVLAALAAVLAVPPARTAVLDWLGIGSARIVRVDELPAVSPTVPLDLLGEPTTLAGAGAAAGFPLAAPPEGEPEPDEIRVVPGARASYVWLQGEGVRLLITQLPGAAGEPALLKKLAAGGTTVEQLRVDGDPAVWLEGGPHVVYLLGPDGAVRHDAGRLAGNTLLVDRGGVTVRVEGVLERDDAIALVRAMPR